MCRATQTKLARVGGIGDDRWEWAAKAHNINGTHHGLGTRRFRRRRTRGPRRLRRTSVAAVGGGRVDAAAAVIPKAAVALVTLHPRRKLLFASGALGGDEFELAPPAHRNIALPADYTVGEVHSLIFEVVDFPSPPHYELFLILVFYQGKGPIAGVNRVNPIPFATTSNPDQNFYESIGQF